MFQCVRVLQKGFWVGVWGSDFRGSGFLLVSGVAFQTFGLRRSDPT